MLSHEWKLTASHFPDSKMLTSPRLKSLLLAGTFLLHSLSYSHATAPVCGPGATVPIGGGKDGIEIDKAWSGTTVTFDAISRGGKIYVGYYDADRWLTVAQLEPASGVVCRARISSQFAGWDSHNSVALAFDSAGRLQVAANMHASPLVYGSANTPDTVSGITLTPMTGHDERKVTYPNFVNGADGTLYFSYRNGVSGNGEWFVNTRYGEYWKRTLDVPIFSSTWNGLPTNAYPTPFKVFQDGYVHLAIVWRRSPDVASNYAITYARTRDFVHWEDHLGHQIEPPITPGNSDVVDTVGEGNGLLNSARVGLTENGSPVIAYTKYGPDGRNVMVLASPGSNGWHRSIIATASSQTVLKGMGTVPNLPAFGELDLSHDHVGGINIVFPGEPRKRIWFNVDTLQPADTPKLQTPLVTTRPLDTSPPPDLFNERRTVLGVREDRASKKAAGSIVYFSQEVNRDRARDCTVAQPTACNPPPSPLIFVP